MTTLQAAANATDAELDFALMRVGILAPADLDEIRSVLSGDTVSLRASANVDGHCVIEVSDSGQLFAYVHHDGRVFVLTSAGRAA